MRIACWVNNAHSEYVISIAYPMQQWLHKGASMLRYIYTACLEAEINFSAKLC